MADAPSITREDVLAIAELAKINLSESEVDEYTSQLTKILEHFKDLQEVDTSEIEQTASVLPLKNVLRDDIAKKALDPKEAVANAPQSEDNQFRVSAVLSEQ